MNNLNNMKNMLSLNLDNKASNFEQNKYITINDNVNVNGYIDYIDDNRIYEFKCTKGIDSPHYLQLLIYAWMCIPENITRNYYIFNPVTNECHQLIIDNG